MTNAPNSLSGPSIVLFDGVCNFCNASVNFVIDRDPHASFKFGALQSEEGVQLLSELGITPDYLDSILLVENGKVFKDSTAALKIAKKLSGLWPILYGFIVVPAPVRDLVYRWIARNRYKWFGKMDSCRLPTPEYRARFI